MDKGARGVPACLAVGQTHEITGVDVPSGGSLRRERRVPRDVEPRGDPGGRHASPGLCACRPEPGISAGQHGPATRHRAGVDTEAVSFPPPYSASHWLKCQTIRSGCPCCTAEARRVGGQLVALPCLEGPKRSPAWPWCWSRLISCRTTWPRRTGVGGAVGFTSCGPPRLVGS